MAPTQIQYFGPLRAIYEENVIFFGFMSVFTLLFSQYFQPHITTTLVLLIIILVQAFFIRQLLHGLGPEYIPSIEYDTQVVMTLKMATKARSQAIDIMGWTKLIAFLAESWSSVISETDSADMKVMDDLVERSIKARMEALKEAEYYRDTIVQVAKEFLGDSSLNDLDDIEDLPVLIEAVKRKVNRETRSI
ncbi:hypothetical protein BS50DRAFT_582133 [Corynespora cassiicola Philippines]|uniref:Uncharacterized protein n=1 Tax=Corynespora cassiicola Philippines TaxID=1448308 RepID=A0A2T2PCQ8_CORCC|nr:hypothetical protein BS50DRAFT_582133 [Corynespora cassiicola Philippines]